MANFDWLNAGALVVASLAALFGPAIRGQHKVAYTGLSALSDFGHGFALLPFAAIFFGISYQPFLHHLIDTHAHFFALAGFAGLLHVADGILNWPRRHGEK